LTTATASFISTARRSKQKNNPAENCGNTVLDALQSSIYNRHLTYEALDF
jgi:hypothetical protein